MAVQVGDRGRTSSSHRVVEGGTVLGDVQGYGRVVVGAAAAAGPAVPCSSISQPIAVRGRPPSTMRTSGEPDVGGRVGVGCRRRPAAARSS